MEQNFKKLPTSPRHYFLIKICEVVSNASNVGEESHTLIGFW